MTEFGCSGNKNRYVEPKNEIIIGSFVALLAVKLSERKVQTEKDKVASKLKKKKYQRNKVKTPKSLLNQKR